MELQEKGPVDGAEPVAAGATVVEPLAYARPEGPMPVVNSPFGRIDLTIILLRVVAMYQIAAGAIALIGMLVAIASDLRSAPQSAMQYSPLLAPLVIGLVLWFVATPLARALFRDAADDGTVQSGNYRPTTLFATRLHAIAISVVGIYFVASAGTHLSSLLFYLSAGDEQYGPDANRGYIRQAAYDLVIQVAVGIGLFWWSRSLAAGWRRSVPGRPV